jgi:predicted nucleotidyltransferase
MESLPTFNLHREQIQAIVELHHASNARTLSEFAFSQLAEDSGMIILIDPTPETTLFDIGAIRLELQKLLGFSVEVLTPNALPESIRVIAIANALPI